MCVPRCSSRHSCSIQHKGVSYNLITERLRRFNEPRLLPSSFLLSQLDESCCIEAVLSINHV